MLASRLPAYMVPGHIEIVGQLPRLPSGKIDRKVLCDVSLEPATAPGRNRSPPPRNRDEAALFSALEKLFPAGVIGPDADFFDDLGGALAAGRPPRFEPPVRSGLRGDEHSRCLSSAAVGSDCGSDAARRERSRPRGAVRRVPISLSRRALCGLAQAVTVPFLVVLHIASWLAPFFVYHFFTGDEGDSIALASVYSVVMFLAMQVGTFGVAILGKWLIGGRLRAGRYPLWGWTHFRWWFASRLCELPPLDLLTGTPLLVWYFRALGAKIGGDVQIDSLDLQVPDLLTVEPGASIGMMVHIANARAERGELVLGPVRIDRDAAVESYAVLEDNTAVGAGACLGGLSALPSGCRVPRGQTWEGSPARLVERVHVELPARPSFSPLARLLQLSFFSVASLAVSTLFFITVFPCFILIDWTDSNLWNLYEVGSHPLFSFGFYFLLGIPASMVLVLATVLLAAGIAPCDRHAESGPIGSLWTRLLP